LEDWLASKPVVSPLGGTGSASLRRADMAQNTASGGAAEGEFRG
jgi:hypothetical protein